MLARENKHSKSTKNEQELNKTQQVLTEHQDAHKVLGGRPERAQQLRRAQQPWLSQEPSYEFVKLITQQQRVKTPNQNDRNQIQAINNNG